METITLDAVAARIACGEELFLANAAGTSLARLKDHVTGPSARMEAILALSDKVRAANLSTTHEEILSIIRQGRERHTIPQTGTREGGQT